VSITAMIPAAIAAESGSLPWRRQVRQCGRPARSRTQTGLLSPQPAHGSGLGPQAPQYQSSPRRRRVRNCLPHPAQTGGEMITAPAWRSAISRSPATQGAGDRPSVRISGTLQQRAGEAAMLGTAPGHARLGQPARSRYRPARHHA
jgi:hypothetical protein